ncbi:MAG: hypothetical protein KAT77_00095 [Nanoarchaeota archaeon]|nr:hypothetical protein [Nanoarchaeota archaeon]
MVEEEKTIKDMLKAIESFSIQLKEALEQNNKEAIKENLQKLRRQNWRLYRRAQREHVEDSVKKTRQIAAEISYIKKNLDNPKVCMKYLGVIIKLVEGVEEQPEQVDGRKVIYEFFKIFNYELDPDLISQGNIKEIIEKSNVNKETALIMNYYARLFKLDILIQQDVEQAFQNIEKIQTEVAFLRSSSIKSLHDLFNVFIKAFTRMDLEKLQTVWAVVYLFSLMKNINRFYLNFILAYYAQWLGGLFVRPGRKDYDPEALFYIEELIHQQLGLFRDRLVYEVGGDDFQFVAYPKYRKHPYLSYVNLEEGGHTHVPERYRLTLESWNKLFPKQAHITMSTRVISYGSGMKYGRHSEAYCAMELLTCFANLTRKGYYSIHWIEVGEYMENPKFLKFIGLSILDKYTLRKAKGLGLYIYQKVNNKTTSKKEFEEWFYQSKYSKEI